jgi:hypothetical protein
MGKDHIYVGVASADRVGRSLRTNFFDEIKWTRLKISKCAKFIFDVSIFHQIHTYIIISILILATKIPISLLPP